MGECPTIQASVQALNLQVLLMGRDFINSLLTQLHIEFQGKGVNYYYGYLCFNRLVLNERSRKTAKWAFGYSGKCMMIVMQVR